jgi:hypothetical protein
MSRPQSAAVIAAAPAPPVVNRAVSTGVVMGVIPAGAFGHGRPEQRILQPVRIVAVLRRITSAESAGVAAETHHTMA